MPTLRKMLPSANALFVFEAAARTRNFTKAAAELNVTQPAISRMLARLESHLGVALFARTSTGVMLTEHGRMLYQCTSDGFRGIEAGLQEINARRTGTETVTLSLSSAFTTHWLMPRINRLQREFPSVDLRFQLIPGSLAGPVDNVDLGMRFVDGGDARHEASLVMREVMLPVCCQSYLERRRGGHTLIHLGDAEPTWAAEFAGLRPGPGGQVNTLHFSDYAVVVQAAILGQGIALGWITVVSHWLLTGDLVPAERALMRTGRQCQLVRSRRKPLRSAVADIRDWIIAQMRADITAIEQRYPDLGLLAASF
jgi:DNA-binding transcriptional LysR family regulator